MKYDLNEFSLYNREKEVKEDSKVYGIIWKFWGLGEYS